MTPENLTRKGSDKIYFLGKIKEYIIPFSNDVKVYKHGTAPDTILNFGSTYSPLYCEINNNGKLNIKINLSSNLSEEEKKVEISKYQELINELRKCDEYADIQVIKNKKIGKSKTLAQLDVGISHRNKSNIFYSDNFENTIDKIKTGLIFLKKLRNLHY